MGVLPHDRVVGGEGAENVRPQMVVKGSISSTFYVQIFPMNVVSAAFSTYM